MSLNTEHWLYLKVYFEFPAEGDWNRDVDLYLMNVVMQLRAMYCSRQGPENKWFFIRYAEGGFHLRVRFYTANLSLQSDIYDTLHHLHESYFEQPEVRLSIREIVVDDYQPELDKYGGIVNMDNVERNFAASSEVVLKVIELANNTGLKKELLAIWLLHDSFCSLGLCARSVMVVLLGYFKFWLSNFPADGRSIEEIMEKNYLKRKAGLVLLFENKFWKSSQLDLLNECKTLWQKSLKGVMRTTLAYESESRINSSLLANALEQQSTFRDIPKLNANPFSYLVLLPNLIHMFHNRLGISVMEETQLAYLLFRFVQDEAQESIGIFEMILENR